MRLTLTWDSHASRSGMQSLKREAQLTQPRGLVASRAEPALKTRSSHGLTGISEQGRDADRHTSRAEGHTGACKQRRGHQAGEWTSPPPTGAWHPTLAVPCPPCSRPQQAWHLPVMFTLPHGSGRGRRPGQPAAPCRGWQKQGA